ncbi:MAG: hypothetical protein U0992_08180 [Planctomycetaceae bacterium]
MAYPEFVFYPNTSTTNTAANQVFSVFNANQAQIDTTQHDPILSKAALISVLTPGLVAIGQTPALDVPKIALYGRQGATRYSFTVDLETSAFSLFIGTMNARDEVFRHLVQLSFLQVVSDNPGAGLCTLAVPLRTIHGGTPRQDFEETVALVEALFAHSHLSLLSGLLLLGY